MNVHDPSQPEFPADDLPADDLNDRLDSGISEQLWQRVRPNLAVDSACPTPLVLASYADGRLASGEAAKIESHLAGCGTCVKAFVDACEAREASSLPFVPAAVIEAACDLVGRGRNRSHRTWVFVARWSVATAACLAMGVLGYQAGFSTPGPFEGASSDGQVAFGMLGDDESSDELFSMFSLAGEIQ